MDIKSIAAVMAVSFGLVQAVPARIASVPGHASLDALPNCTEVSLRERCRVDLANGDFEGPEGDAFYHGGFTWSNVTNYTHPVRDHLQPWTYVSDAGDAHLDEPAVYRTPPASYLTLHSPRDHVYQWLKLTPGRDTDAVFTLHAHVASTGGDARAVLNIAVPEDGGGLSVIEQSKPLRAGKPRREIVASLTLPADSKAERIGFAIAAAENSSGVLVDDVFVVRTPVGDALPELTPAW